MRRLWLVLFVVTLSVPAGEVPLRGQSKGDSAQPRQERRQRGNRRPRAAREDNAPKVGDIAPLFNLQSHDGQSETDVETFRGERPVVLFFGSYT